MIGEKDVLVSVRTERKWPCEFIAPDGPGPFPTLFASSAHRYDNNICRPTRCSSGARLV